MPNKTINLLLVLLFLAGPLLGQAGKNRPQAGPPVSKEELAALYRVMAIRPFLEDSPDLRTDPGTIGKFFNQAVYEKLKGNRFYGYTYDEGYTPPAEKTVCLRLVTTLPTLKQYERALLYALVAGAVRAGWKPAAAAPAEIGVCLLGVDQKSQPGQAGILIEAYLKNDRTNKARFLRCAFGQGSLDDAFMQAAEFLMRMVGQ